MRYSRIGKVEEGDRSDGAKFHRYTDALEELELVRADTGFFYVSGPKNNTGRVF
jgi:hypothetical protein